MAEDPRSQLDTEDLPEASEAFSADRATRLEDATNAVSRSAALLALVTPDRIETGTYRNATSEVRERLGVEPVGPFRTSRDALAQNLEEVGDIGSRAARFLREERYGRRIDDEPHIGPPAADRAELVLRDLRAAPPVEQERVAALQREVAPQVFRSAELIDRTRRDPATRLIAVSLLDEDPLVRVAAAAATLRFDSRNPLAEGILSDAARHGSDEIAILSRAVLVTDRRAEDRVIEIEYPPGEADPLADTTLVHGTWARRGRWWRPDGDLHRYLRGNGLFPHLYQGPDPFRWSGYFSFRMMSKPSKDWSRQQAADSLAWWTHRRLKAPPDLIGHSYGGSLSMMATRSEKTVRGMVLLSPAVHRTCLPDHGNYEQILHVTTSIDLVLLADLSTPDLLASCPNVAIRCVKRKGLTGHRAARDPKSWQSSGLTDFVRDEWLPMLSAR